MFLLMEEEKELINLDNIVSVSVWGEDLTICYEADEDGLPRKKCRNIQYCDEEHADKIFNEICEGIKSGTKIIEI